MPKKEKKLSDNIRRFLERKEEEERQRKLEAKERKERLLELRRADKKSSRAMNSMLKMTKSSNKSVVLEALNSTDTAATLAGRQQCDEDDYGYESSTAHSLYEKLMRKYEGIKEEPKFPISKPNKTAKANLSKTVARVKNALDKGDDDYPSKRSKVGLSSSAQDAQSEVQASKNSVKKSKREIDLERARQKRLALANKLPKPQSFNDLINLAEKKSKRPAEGAKETSGKELEGKKKEKPVKECEFERPMTKKEKEEYMRENRLKLGLIPSTSSKDHPSSTKNLDNSSDSKKLNQSSVSTSKNKACVQQQKQQDPPEPTTLPSNTKTMPTAKSKASEAPSPSTSKKSIGNKTTLSTYTPSKSVSKSGISESSKNGQIVAKDKAVRNVGGNNTVSKASSLSSVPSKTSKTRGKPAERSVPLNRAKANQVLSEDEEDDDSDMDDFIDDSDAKVDISAEIRGIFGYDRRQYRDEEFDDRSMETNRFSEVMREEARSAKIGLQEDLEDMRREEEEKKRRRNMKKMKQGRS